MALCDSHSGSHWLSLPLSGILWPSLTHYCSLISCIQPLIGSQGPCSALIADATMAHVLPLCMEYKEHKECKGYKKYKDYWEYKEYMDFTNTIASYRYGANKLLAKSWVRDTQGHWVPLPHFIQCENSKSNTVSQIRQ